MFENCALDDVCITSMAVLNLKSLVFRDCIFDVGIDTWRNFYKSQSALVHHTFLYSRFDFMNHLALSILHVAMVARWLPSLASLAFHWTIGENMPQKYRDMLFALPKLRHISIHLDSHNRFDFDHLCKQLDVFFNAGQCEPPDPTETQI